MNELKKLCKRISHKASRTMERAVNQRAAYDFPPTCAYIEKRDVPVLGNSTTGTMFDPYAIDLDGSYAMYISKRASGTVERWDSPNGISWHWTTCSLPGNVHSREWDSSVNRVCVLQIEGIWYMWYTGQHGGKSAIGLARSEDGLTFERLSRQPVLTPTLPHETSSVMNPCVLLEQDGTLRMWYAAGDDYEPDVICEAVSSDGENWTKLKEPVLKKGTHPYDAFKVGGCSVLRLDECNLAMFYIGYQNLDVARICLAFSTDNGTTWHRSSMNPLIGPERGAWDAHAVYKPSVIRRADGKILIWYNARNERDEYIGMATIEDIEFLR